MMTSLYNEPNALLIDRVKAGDKKAQYQLYQQYARAMYGVCGRLVGAGPLAEELLQDAFVRAFKNIHQYEQKAAFGAWLKQIVIRTVLNHLQKKSRVWLPLEALPEEPHTAPHYDDQLSFPPTIGRAAVQKAMQELADGYRIILNLYLFEGYDHEEIATILNISASTSKSQYSRAKKRLRGLLEQ